MGVIELIHALMTLMSYELWVMNLWLVLFIQCQHHVFSVHVLEPSLVLTFKLFIQCQHQVLPFTPSSERYALFLFGVLRSCNFMFKCSCDPYYLEFASFLSISWWITVVLLHRILTWLFGFWLGDKLNDCVINLYCDFAFVSLS